MDRHAWSRQAIVAAAALVLAAAMPLGMEAQAHPLDHRIDAGYQVAAGADEGSTVDKADPTDDGSIIIECVGFNSRMLPYVNQTASMLHAVSMPQYPLGPSKCWSGDHKQGAMGGGAGGFKSNCVSVAPVETECGRKRMIAQSTCNKDFSCVKGFCPSFVTVEGGRLRKPEKAQAGEVPPLPDPIRIGQSQHTADLPPRRRSAGKTHPLPERLGRT